MYDLQRILVPVDFSGCSISALRYAVRFAVRFGATVEILHVYRPPNDFFPPIPITEPDGSRRTAFEFAREEAEKELGDLVQREVASRGVEVVPMVACGDPTQEILLRAGTGRYDLVIMGTRGRSGISHWLLGSVAESVVRRSSCPVLTIRPPRLKERSTRTAAPASGPGA